MGAFALIAGVITMYQAQDVNGVWHNVTAFQAAALKLDGVPVRKV